MGDAIRPEGNYRIQRVYYALCSDNLPFLRRFANLLRFTQDYHTYLTKRFDRIKDQRIHFASAMTLLGHTDGADATANVSYLHRAEFIARHGTQPNADLEELWRRIVFNICVSNRREAIIDQVNENISPAGNTAKNIIYLAPVPPVHKRRMTFPI